MRSKPAAFIGIDAGPRTPKEPPASWIRKAGRSLRSAYVSANPQVFSEGEIHSDFGTGFIYSDDGDVADPSTQSIVGTYNASGLVAPDSSLNRVFVLGQTSEQANSSNFTIESFNENTYAAVSSITIQNVSNSANTLGSIRPCHIDRQSGGGLQWKHRIARHALSDRGHKFCKQ